MTAEECAAIILRATEKRQRLVFTSSRGRLLRWLQLMAPAVVDRLAEKAIRERR
jgi:hypothetical protein